MEQEKGCDFKIADKRGRVEESEPEKTDATAPEEPRNPTGSGSGNEPEGKEIDFITFLLSLYSSAMAAFGMLPSPEEGNREENVEAGKEMIDILGLLQTKTRGNLNAEETRLLENMLYELRMLYLEKRRLVTL